MDTQSLANGSKQWAKTPTSRRKFLAGVLTAVGALGLQQVLAAPRPATKVGATMAVPQTLPYQGRIADASGQPLTGLYSMTFRLYDSASPTAYPLWEENWTGPNSVKVSDGLFNVMLGSIEPIPHAVIYDNTALWLGVTVGADNEMTPRIPLGSAPYAIYAQKAVDADTVDGIHAQDIVTAAVNASPAGIISAYGGATAPDGWLLCDGAAVSRTQYAKLFTAIGVAWGAGDGSTTFHLPDLRGRFLRGVDGGTGRDEDAANRAACNTGGNTGAAVGSCQMDKMQAHKHNDTGHTHGYRTQVIDDADEFESGDGKHGADDLWADYNTYAGTANLTDPVTSSGGAPRYGMETRPENAAVVYIIKY